MNKADLIKAIASECDATQAQAGDMLDAMCGAIVGELKNKGDVMIPGFGKFIARHRESREVRNPATGQMMMSKAKTSAVFKPAAALKDL